MMIIERLLWLADDLSKRSIQIRSATLKRRAVSTAYYAVFHALARLCAKELLGADVPAKTMEYERVYRALDHGTLKTVFNIEPLKDNQSLKQIGERVVRLQSERIDSDYLPSRRIYTKVQCEDLVKSAKSTVELINSLSERDRQTLAVCLLFKKRSQ